MTDHKNQPFYKRVGFALSGIGHAVRNEQSARIQVGAFVIVLAALLILRPGPFWWALTMLASAGVFEKLEIKREIFKAMDEKAPVGATLASSTSTLRGCWSWWRP